MRGTTAGIGAVHVVIAVHARETFCDDLLSINVVTFLLCTLSTCFALRVRLHNRPHCLARFTDCTFIVSMALLTVACFAITYSLGGGK